MLGTSEPPPPLQPPIEVPPGQSPIVQFNNMYQTCKIMLILLLYVVSLLEANNRIEP